MQKGSTVHPNKSPREYRKRSPHQITTPQRCQKKLIYDRNLSSSRTSTKKNQSKRSNSKILYNIVRDKHNSCSRSNSRSKSRRQVGEPHLENGDTKIEDVNFENQQLKKMLKGMFQVYKKSKLENFEVVTPKNNDESNEEKDIAIGRSSSQKIAESKYKQSKCQCHKKGYSKVQKLQKKRTDDLGEQDSICFGTFGAKEDQDLDILSQLNAFDSSNKD